MALVTGTPLGNLDLQEDRYLEGAPTIFFQRYEANPLKNPDSDGFYWGLSGTTTYPAYELGCVTEVNFSENLTMNDVLCDNIGVKSTIMQRNYVEFTLTLQSPFPLSTVTYALKTGDVTLNAAEGTEKMPIGQINNQLFWMVYAIRVYDELTGDYVVFHLHKCQFVDAWSLDTPFGDKWAFSNIKMRAFADSTKPSAQTFGNIIRADYSVLGS